jgi:hypothetical protein
LVDRGRHDGAHFRHTRASSTGMWKREGGGIMCPVTTFHCTEEVAAMDGVRGAGKRNGGGLV